MNDELLKSAREVIGDYLRQRREEKGLSRYRVMQLAGWSRIDPILKIERGESYGIEMGIIQDMFEAGDITRAQARALRRNVYVMSVDADASL